MGTRNRVIARRVRAAKIGQDRRKLVDSIRIRPDISPWIAAKVLGIGRKSDGKKGSSRQFTDQYPW